MGRSDGARGRHRMDLGMDLGMGWGPIGWGPMGWGMGRGRLVASRTCARPVAGLAGGLFTKRWLFFTEVIRTVALFYGAEKAGPALVHVDVRRLSWPADSRRLSP